MIKGNPEESGRLECPFKMRKGRKRRARDKRIEDSLAKRLFGSSADLNDDDESSGEDSPAEDINSHDTAVNESEYTERKQVWFDDDDDETISLPQHRRDIHLLRSTDADRGTISAKEYEKRLREAFIRTRGSGRSTPKWATKNKELDSRSTLNAEYSDESDADEVEVALRRMTASTGTYIHKGELLPKGVLSVSKSIDITRGHRQQKLPMRALQFHPRQQVVMIGGENGTISLFEIGLAESEEHFLQDVTFKGFPVSCAAFSYDGLNIIAGSRKKSYLFSYDLMEGKVSQLRPPCVMSNINCGSFGLSMDGKFVAVRKRNEVHLLSLRSMEYIGALTTPTPVTSVEFSPNSSNELYAMTESGDVFFWDIRSPEKQRKFSDDGAVRGTVVRISRNEQFIACGSNTGIVNLYELNDAFKSDNPTPLRSFDQLTTSADFLCFNGDSQMLAMSSSVKSNAIRIAHVRSGSVFSNFPPRNIRLGKTTLCDFSPNSGYFGVGDRSGFLSLFTLNHFNKY
uniref:U3 small nucleolar RNA-associated protein 18-like protein n=1 Tax=Parascaris univalens TaxID=6257 RepID=A0A915AJC9_PARUN